MKKFSSFSQSGLFTPRGVFLNNSPNEILLDDCTDVIVYDGGHFIQVLKGGTFYVDDNNKSKVLDDVEINLYIEKVIKN
jgi:hypothetical protein